MKTNEKHGKKLDDLSALVEMCDTSSVLNEALTLLEDTYPGADNSPVEKVFNDVVMLFCGQYPEYLECNTEYHDLRHTTDVFLCMARLLHGHALSGRKVPHGLAAEGLMSAMFHDTGYIQRNDDADGTGAKYTKVHVQRSIDFMRQYFKGSDNTGALTNMISATMLSQHLDDIPFGTDDEKLVGKALFSADLIGQMADRIYLEKLLFLFMEFREGGVMGFESELDLLEKTVDFYRVIKKRIEEEAGYDTNVMKAHFSKRWGMERDLYAEAANNNMQYLQRVLSSFRQNYRGALNREGIVKRLESMEHGLSL